MVTFISYFLIGFGIYMMTGGLVLLSLGLSIGKLRLL